MQLHLLYLQQYYIYYMRRTAKKLTAILLLFLFLEKAGLRLWIHTHYHECTTSTTLSKDDKTPHPSFGKKCCDCMDDFFIPLDFTDEISISIPAVHYSDVFVIYKSRIHCTAYNSSFLRGPPSVA